MIDATGRDSFLHKAADAVRIACAAPRPSRSPPATVLVPLWQHLTVITVAALGGRLSRSHPAVAWNFLEGCTRALAVLLVGLAVAQLGAWRSATRLTTWLVRLGRGSLLAYAVHIPLCYGRLARPIAHRLDMPLATVLVLALIAFTYAVIWVRDRARGAASARSQPAR